MIIVLFVIFLAGLIFGVHRLVSCSGTWDIDGIGLAFVIPCSVAALVCAILGGVLARDVTHLAVVDEKIQMYEEENTKIETQIAEVVEKYQEYETGIFTEVRPESSMTMVTMYPNLKSDKLVEKQIETYVANNDKIKSLKELKTSGKVYRWWLYFGG